MVVRPTLTHIAVSRRAPIVAIVSALGFWACAACSRRSASLNQTERTDSMSSAGGGYTTTITGHLADSIVRLGTNDSVEWQSSGPAQVRGKADGLLVTYYPFFDIADTARVRRIAMVFFDSLRVRLPTEGPRIVVMRAVNLRATEREKSTYLRAFGVVLENDGHGQYYPLHSPKTSEH
jgi:hypothetical protein